MLISSFKKALASIIIVPLLFSLIASITIYGMLKPVIDTTILLVSGIVANEATDFDSELSSIYIGNSIVDRNTVPLSEVVIPFFGTHYANISIERINMNTNLYWGDSDKILRYGAGQYIGSFLPGFGRPLLIAGHNLSIFRKLEDVIIGDTITIQTNYSKYVYLVDKITIKKANDPTFFDLSLTEEQLIMYTCYPFKILSSRLYDRYIVYGHRISGPDIK